MTKLEQLIEELCPDGVEFRPLEKCCQVLDNKRKPIAKSAREAGEYPYYGANGVQDYVADYIFDGTFILVGEDGSVLTPGGTPVVNWAEGKMWVNNHAHIIEEIDGVLLRYLFHYLQTIDVRDLIHGNIPKLTQGDFRQLKIAVPPLPVQSEIVRILDNFTESSAKLIADLERERILRKKQYLEYSHALFTQSDCVKRTTLGEIVDVCMCKRIMKTQTDTVGDVPFYQNGTLGGEAKLYISNELFQEYSQKYKFPNQGDVMLSTVGTVGKTIQYDGKPAYFQDSNIVWLKRKNEDVTNEYLYWFCISMPWKLPERATLKHLHNYMIAETEISIPSKERQAYVIEKFQELERAFRLIDAELTAEIEARRSQYEFYRDELLTFAAKG